MGACESLQIVDEGFRNMCPKPKTLIDTNPYLRDSELRKKMLKRSVESSSAIEGVHVNLDKIGFRCEPCNKLLAKPNAKGETAGQIKCPRCGELNER